MLPSVESPIERYAREGGDLGELFDAVGSPPSVAEIEANAGRTVMTPYGEQDGNGVDLTLLRQLLQLTVPERLARGAAAARAVLDQREHARRHSR